MAHRLKFRYARRSVLSYRNKTRAPQETSTMNLAGKDRNRQLVTVGIGTVLALVMGAVLIAGFRLATQMRANITALQTASVLQTYPAAMSQQFNALRDRLESRAYAGQALADLKATVQRFDTELEKLSTSGYVQSAELDQALLL